MIWQHPVAWIGLISLAVPLLVHLVGRRRPKLLRFPTLRFFELSRIVPARRHRLSDVPLMLVRMAILAAAVAAIAGPVFGSRARGGRDALARAIVIDTSASMSRSSAAGRPVAAIAKERAQAAAQGVANARTIEASSLSAGVAQASTWLADRPGRHEIEIISDFQTGALDAADLGVVPTETGLKFTAVDAVATADVDGPRLILPGAAGDRRQFGSRVHLAPDATSVAWTPVAGTAPAVASSLTVLAGPDERPAVDAALDAAQAEGVPVPADRRVTVVFPHAPERVSLEKRRRVSFYDLRKTTPEVVFLFPDSNPGDVRSAQFLREVLRAIGASDATTVTESEPTRIPAETLQAWSRPASEPAAPARPREDESDGRWLWAVALALLGIEMLMRRARPAPAREMDHARVA
jgi:hypothetical protein